MTLVESTSTSKVGWREVLALLLPVVLGFMAWGLWIYEVKVLIGWRGLAWLGQPLYSIYIVILLTVLSYLAPILLWSKAKWYVILLCIAILYGTAYGGYYYGRLLFAQLYVDLLEGNQLDEVWGLMLLALVIAVLFFFTKQLFLFKSGSFHVLTLLAMIISVVPASLVTVEQLPGFGGGHSFVDAVKMGYPIFWANVFFGWVAMAMVKKVI